MLDKAVVVNVLYLTSEKLLRFISAIFVGAWIARYLGPEGFGLFSLGLALSMIFSPIAGAGLRQIVYREFIKKPEDKYSNLFFNASLSMLITGFIALFFACLTIFAFDDDDSHILLLIIMCIPLIFKFTEVPTYYFEAMIESRIMVVIRCGFQLFFILVKCVLILLDAGILLIAIAVGAETILSGLTALAYMRTKPKFQGEIKFQPMECKALVRAGFPLLISGLLSALVLRVDQFVLRQLVGIEELGIYSAALRIPENLTFVPAVLWVSIAPRVFQSVSAENHNATNFSFSGVNYSILALSVSVALVFSLFNELIINTLFGIDYNEAIGISSILIWVLPLFCIVSSRSYWLLNNGFQALEVPLMFSTLILNFLLNLFLIPIFGGAGAAWSSLLSLLIIILVSPVFSQRLRSFYREVFVLKYSEVLLFQSFLRGINFFSK